MLQFSENVCQTEGSSSDSLEKEDLCRAEMARPMEGRSLSGAVPSQCRAQ